MSDHLPEVIVTEILKRLPVKALVKSTSVCKSWYSLITNPNFIALHLSHTTAPNKTYSLLRKSSDVIEYSNAQQFILHSDNDSFSEHEKLDLSYLNVTSDTPGTHLVKIVGLCDGLFCLFDKNLTRLIVWNPAIRVFITTSLRGRYKAKFFLLGFGFDSNKNDYKVVRIVYNYAGVGPLTELVQPFVEIFELKSNAWKTVAVENLSYALYDSGSYAYLNGYAHWFAQKEQGRKLTVASFDLSNEAFGELMLPHSLAELSHLKLSLIVYRQSLAVVYPEDPKFDNNSYHCEKYSIWVMQEYGAHESWSKLFNIDLENRGGFRSVLGFQGNGGILVENFNRKMASYDPETQRVTPLEVDGFYFKVHSNYMESLVLLMGNRN
ncbi:putative F-box protein At3g17490 [Mercurialis annua]|uniref:putative F-box protein At3g17490 n=1 Tax=Mercurialis annua TaxID=3986 RepID=UPI00215FE900|nr:putative F-box protein At3g17490 [Mercurialis annua]